MNLYVFKSDVQRIIVTKIHELPFNCDNYFFSEQFYFYCTRLYSLANYSLYQAGELIKMICRAAFNDSELTDNESIVIMETCLDSELDKLLMEVNYNEGW